jgi:hypothetical protein
MLSQCDRLDMLPTLRYSQIPYVLAGCVFGNLLGKSYTDKWFRKESAESGGSSAHIQSRYMITSGVSDDGTTKAVDKTGEKFWSSPSVSLSLGYRTPTICMIARDAESMSNRERRPQTGEPHSRTNGIS